MNKKILAITASIFLLIIPVAALASSVNPCTWFVDIVNRFLTIVLWPIFIAVVVLMFIYAGFMFVTSAGDPSKVAIAKKAFVFACVGIVVGIVGFSAVNIINKVIGAGGSSVPGCSSGSTVDLGPSQCNPPCVLPATCQNGICFGGGV